MRVGNLCGPLEWKSPQAGLRLGLYIARQLVELNGGRILDRTKQKSLLRSEGLVQSPAFAHVAVVPPGATTILGGQNGVADDGTLERSCRGGLYGPPYVS
jgi:hypothetical protein